MDLLVLLVRRDLLESLAPWDHLELLDLRVSLDLRDSMVFPDPEVNVVFLVLLDLSVRLAELDLLVLLAPVVPVVTLVCLV